MQAIKDGNWQAARDFLARRFPRRWGLTVRRDPDLSGEAPAEVDLICGEGDPTPSGEPVDTTAQATPPPDIISPESVEPGLAQSEPMSAQPSKTAATPAQTIEAAPPILPRGCTVCAKLIPLEPRFSGEALRSMALLANLTSRPSVVDRGKALPDVLAALCPRL